MFRFVLALECLIVELVGFVLLVLLLGFVVHCIVSTIVVAFEINVYHIYWQAFSSMQVVCIALFGTSWH